MGYLKGKDLLYKGHTLECYLNMCPNYIIFKTNKIMAIQATWDGIGQSMHKDYIEKPEGFEGW